MGKPHMSSTCLHEKKPEGEVVVIKNSTKIKSPGGTTITRDFEVKPGAEFEISVEQ